MSKSRRNILLVALLLALLSTVSYCASPYDTESAQIVEIKDTITGSGFILRRETLVKKTITGVFEPLVKDGTRVGKGSSVGTVISGNLDKKLAEKLAALREEICHLFDQAPKIERGYVVEQALEDGWLVYGEDTIATVGAYIYL